MSAIQYLIFPPVGNVLLALFGAALCRWSRGLGIMLIAIAGISLLALSTPLVSYWLRVGLETYPVLSQERAESAEVVVILGGGRDYDSPEFGWGDAPANATWRRMAYGAVLAKRHDLPVLVAGGRVHGEVLAEAELMAVAMEELFEIEPAWIEGQSTNTQENANYSAVLLREAGVERALLVSQAWHLPRAVSAFQRAGLEVIPAPTEFSSPPSGGIMAFIPRAYHLRQSTQALHEWLGRLVYAVRG